VVLTFTPLAVKVPPIKIFVVFAENVVPTVNEEPFTIPVYVGRNDAILEFTPAIV
jgi:hypothetical protein